MLVEDGPIPVCPGRDGSIGLGGTTQTAGRYSFVGTAVRGRSSEKLLNVAVMK